MGGFIMLLGFAGLLLGLVVIVRPLPRLGLRRRRAGLAVVIGSCLVATVGILSLPKPPSSAEAETAAPPVSPPTAARLIAFREPVKIGPLTITVTQVRVAPSMGAAWGSEGRAAEGGVLVAVGYTVTNSSALPVKAWDVPGLQLVDQAGVRYNADAGKTALLLADSPSLNGKLVSDLNPGITVHDGAMFEVSAKAFDPNTWSVQLGDGARVRLAKAG